ncbi:iron ABC transporter permease [Mollicutes bacterium LVI A0078]|nr:iron ABC transporter permease [Mollicutes bacterium LVI A0075]WOO91564.1 iron ABC transporter permease [Mollicutes bacterium LVI A0078]
MDNRTKRIVIGLLILLGAIAFFSIIFGTKLINPLNPNNSVIDNQIIFELRMPRTIAAIISGMTLAAGGLLIQISMNNQLADTSILGFQSGATLVALVIMLAIPSLYPFLPLFAFIGGILVYGLIYLISKKNSSSVFLIVAGIAISSIIRSMINLVSTLFAENLQSTIAWTNGSLNTVQPNDVKLMIMYSIVLLLVALIVSTRVDILLLDDDYLHNIGVNSQRYRLLIAAVAILLSAVSVSFVGTIGFVGLLAPHIARRLVSNSGYNLMPVTILIGGILVAGCDLLQRLIFPIYEIPVGITMSFIGGTYLVILLIRSNNVRV